MSQTPRKKSSTLKRAAGPGQISREDEHRFRLTFELAPVGIAHVSPDGQFLRVNKKLCDILGYRRTDFMKLDFQTITHPDDLAENLQRVQQILSGVIDSYTLDKRYLHKDGRVVWARLTVSLVRDSEQQPSYFISVLEDISDHKQQEAELREIQTRLESTNTRLSALARTDSLTCCMNRHAFMEELKKTWLYHQRYTRHCTLVFIDIDEFKAINDHYGHTIGDRALNRLAHHIKSSLRDTDIIGRYAGDEFLVLMQEVDDCQAERIMAGIQERPIFIETHHHQSFKLDYSFGIACITEPMIESVEQWINLADERMYQSKNAPRHCQ